MILYSLADDTFYLRFTRYIIEELRKEKHEQD